MTNSLSLTFGFPSAESEQKEGIGPHTLQTLLLPLPVLLLQFLLSLNFSHCESLHLSNSSQTDASPELQSRGVEVMKATSRVPLQDPGSSSASANSLI